MKEELKKRFSVEYHVCYDEEDRKVGIRFNKKDTPSLWAAVKIFAKEFSGFPYEMFTIVASPKEEAMIVRKK